MKSFPLPATLRRHTASVVARILSPRGVLVAGIVLLGLHPAMPQGTGESGRERALERS